MGADILTFPEDKITRKFKEPDSEPPEPTVTEEEKDQRVMDLFISLMGVVDAEIYGDNFSAEISMDSIKEYCFVQQAILALVEKLADRPGVMHKFIELAINLKENVDDDEMVSYTCDLPPLALIDPETNEYRIIDLVHEDAP